MVSRCVVTVTTKCFLLMASSLFPSPPGPSLPSFNSLLVRGPYPPSAPLHLCLSHIQANAGNVLFLSPSRQAFATPLQDFNDQWLTTNAAKGQHLNLLSRVQIQYDVCSSTLWCIRLMFGIATLQLSHIGYCFFHCSSRFRVLPPHQTKPLSHMLLH